MTDPTQVAEQKADAKAQADATVSTDPHAVHAVQTMPTSPKALGSTAVGAGVGLVLGGPPGAAVGALVGWGVEKYRVAGGPVGKLWDWIQSKRHAAAAPVAPPAPPAK